MCKAEGPDVEQFARENKDTINVIGLGSQDNYEKAVKFVDDTDTTGFPMLWDQSGQSWQSLGIFGQPAYAIIGPDGNLGITGYGAFDADFVKANAEAYAKLAAQKG